MTSKSKNNESISLAASDVEPMKPGQLATLTPAVGALSPADFNKLAEEGFTVEKFFSWSEAPVGTVIRGVFRGDGQPMMMADPSGKTPKTDDNPEGQRLVDTHVLECSKTLTISFVQIRDLAKYPAGTEVAIRKEESTGKGAKRYNNYTIAVKR